jgi:ABC-type multidrug transport system fused ATPase/permease subunit
MIAFIRDLALKYPLLVTANVTLLVLSSLSGVLSFLSVAPLIDFFLHPGLENASKVTLSFVDFISVLGLKVSKSTFLICFLLTILLTNGFSILSRYSMLHLKYAISLDLTVGSFQDFFDAQWSFFSGNKQGTLLNTFLKEIQVVGNALGAVTLFFSSIIQFVFYMIVPVYISWQLSIVSLAVALIFSWPFFMLGKLNYRLGKVNTSTANEVSSVIQESLSSAKVILGFGNQSVSLERLCTVYKTHIRATLKSQTLTTATPLAYEPLGMLVIVIALVLGGWFTIPLSELVVLLWAFRSSIPLVGEMITRRNSLSNLIPSYEQVQDLRTRARAQHTGLGGDPFPGLDREIRVDNLTFAYPDHPPVLSQVNVVIPKGQMTAIVGESGSGKSTLIDVIMGFHKPQAGQVCIDGIPLSHFDINSCRQRFGYVPQDSILFNASLRENLLWSKPGSTEEEIIAACKQANADGFIRSFPEGYSTRVGDRGVRLSGGQCQRIALARALLRKPDLLILDEATSALDSQSEQLIQQAIEDAVGETTIVVIAHRLSTIVNADYIYVMEKGRVIEEGTYRDLLARNSRLSQMTRLQVLEQANT